MKKQYFIELVKNDLRRELLKKLEPVQVQIETGVSTKC
jgi:hypothetical protein